MHRALRGEVLQRSGPRRLSDVRVAEDTILLVVGLLPSTLLLSWSLPVRARRAGHILCGTVSDEIVHKAAQARLT